MPDEPDSEPNPASEPGWAAKPSDTPTPPTEPSQPAWQQPPQYWQQPNYPPAQYSSPQFAQYQYESPQPKKKSSKKLWMILIGVFLGFVVLGIAGCGALIFWGFNEIQKPIDSTNSYLEAVQSEDYATASKFVCDEQASELGAQELIENVTGGREIDSYSIRETDTDGVSATTGGTIVIEGDKENVIFELEKQDGTYKVCDVDRGKLIRSSSG